MVYYFTSTAVEPAATIYMGKDKYENEELIKHGWPEDIWFHADKLSSAHVYVRLADGCEWDKMPSALVDDLAQLCKANSIEGNKKNNITIIYTPWDNLLKRGDMAVGQVSFKNSKKVKRVCVEARENTVVNRLNKTRREDPNPELMQMRLDRDKAERSARKRAADAQRAEERRVAEQRRSDRDARDYARVFADAKNKKPGAADDIFAADGSDSSDDGLGAHASDFDAFM
ncbi:hypothetical protein IWW48_001964 [Coemansia sp. RSA 1200]|nr:hypothetical protein IWW48_001964 [Coemansia sp. RSA 1200]